jgi:hypothetical protein
MRGSNSLLRGGNFPVAYVYPKGLRETRDLLRRRMFLVRQRAHRIAHIQNTNSQYNLPVFGQSWSLPVDGGTNGRLPRSATPI